MAFIGFGEAAYHIAKGLASEGLYDIIAYDRMQDSVERGTLIRSRAKEVGISLADSLEQACDGARFVLSLTSASVAVSVAQEALPYIKSGTVYVDMNAAGPQVKKKLADIPHSEGVCFCDCAIMGPVPKKGHQTAMLLSGEGAADFKEAMDPYGMDLTVLDAPLGGASAIKMFRSVVLKGIPQLLLEAMLPAQKYGVLDTLIESLNDTFAQTTVNDWCDLFITRTIIHAERRAHEMEDVITTLQDMKMDASMSASTCRKLRALADLKLTDSLDPRGTTPYLQAMELILEREGA